MGICHSSSSRKLTTGIRKFARQNIRQFYRFGKVLGSGSFGTVRLAYHLLEEKNGQVSKAFAIKSINKETVGESFYMIQRELDILTQLDHPNIIRFYETFEDEKYYHFVMEYCSGGELFERIQKKGTFTEKQAAIMMGKLFSAIQYVHSQGIAHRDLKPENLLLSSEETFDVKIIDFGLSKKFKDMKNQGKQGQAGTPLYVSPEVLDGKACLESDNWSLGCIMYVFLSGNTPFYSEDKQKLAAMIIHWPVKFEEFQWEKVSEEAKDLIKGLLQKDPKKRTTCKQAMSSPWMLKVLPKGQKKSFYTMTSYNDSIQYININLISEIGQQSITSLQHYANSTKFKKETLKILLNQLKETEISGLRDKFEALDKDGNGVISPDELMCVMGQMGYTQTEKEINELMRKINTENLKPEQLHIKYSEFLAATLNSKAYLNKQRLWCLFKQFDIKNKGYIELEDLRQTLEREGKINFLKLLFIYIFLQNKIGRNQSDIWSQEIFREIDLNKIGRIEFNDFCTMMYQNIEMENLLENQEEQVQPIKEQPPQAENVLRSGKNAQTQLLIKPISAEEQFNTALEKSQSHQNPIQQNNQDIQELGEQ